MRKAYGVLLLLVLLMTFACSHRQYYTKFDHLIRSDEVINTINRLFIKTDNKDWPAVKALFADEVLFDMTSLAGGQPSKLSPQQIVDAWDKGLKNVAAIHHQAGNYIVTLGRNGADVFCYGIAKHYNPEHADKKITTFVGSYDFHLINTDSGWKIDRFKFNKKYVD